MSTQSFRGAGHAGVASMPLSSKGEIAKGEIRGEVQVTTSSDRTRVDDQYRPENIIAIGALMLLFEVGVVVGWLLHP